MIQEIIVTLPKMAVVVGSLVEGLEIAGRFLMDGVATETLTQWTSLESKI